jgi:hypothetical protein
VLPATQRLATQRSAAITAAATLAIVGSCVALLGWGWFSYLLFETVQSFRRQGIPFKNSQILFIGAAAVIPPVLAFLGLQTGAGLFRLEAWARKSALLWAATSLLFCIFLLVNYPYQIFVIDSDHWSSELVLLKQFFAQALLIALTPISVWWIFLFTRLSVKAQFADAQNESSNVK